MNLTEEPTIGSDQSPPVAGAARRRIGGWLRPLVAVLLLAGLIAVPSLQLQLPGVLPGPTYAAGTLQLLASCLLIGALAVTYNLVFAVSGLLSFGHALFFALGCYVFGMLLEHARMAPIPAACITLVVGILTSLVVGLINLRVSGIAFAMVSLAFAQAASVLVLRNVHGLTGGEEGLGLTHADLPGWLLGVANTQNLYYLALGVAALVLAGVGWLVRSRLGQLMLAVRENELRVRVLGIRPYLVRLVAFTAAGSLATVVGMAYLLVQGGANPQITTSSFTLTLLVMVILGGLGSRWGAMLGGMLYTLLNQRLGVLAASAGLTHLPAVLRVPLSQPTFLLGALFVLLVLFLPGGLTGGLARLVGRGESAPLAELSEAEAA